MKIFLAAVALASVAIVLTFIASQNAARVSKTSISEQPFLQESEGSSYTSKNTPLPENKLRVTYVDRLTSYWGPTTVSAAIGVPDFAQPTLYTVINLAFILYYGSADAAAVWANPFGFMERDNNPFGNTPQKVHEAWLKLYHEKSIRIMVSAFGATENPTSAKYDAEQYCTRLANFVKDNQLDGIDLDWEDNLAMNQGLGEDWLIRCTRAIRVVLPKGEYILTHAPQAPYFKGKPKYPNGGYVTVNDEVGDLIDWYNVQFYNQGDTTYDTYELLFIDAKYGEWNGTAVKQIAAKGVPLDKIVVGKPVTPADASNTGYVPAADLHEWAARAAVEIGWNTGLMDWQYSSDQQGKFIKTYIDG